MQGKEPIERQAWLEKQIQALIKRALIQLDQLGLSPAHHPVVRRIIIRIAFDSAILAGFNSSEKSGKTNT